MPTPTYIPLANLTLGSATGSVIFSSISGSYRDLVLVVAGTRTGDNNIQFRFNGDDASNYSWVVAGGNGSATTSVAQSLSFIPVATYSLQTNTQLNTIFQVMDYSATDKHKTALARFSQAGSSVSMVAGRWANTAAITSIRVFTGNADFGVGTSFALYGIAS